MAALSPDEQRARVLGNMTPQVRELFEGPGLAAMLDQQTFKDLGLLGGDQASLENSGSQSNESHYKLWYKTHGQHIGGDSVAGDSLTEVGPVFE